MCQPHHSRAYNARSHGVAMGNYGALGLCFGQDICSAFGNPLSLPFREGGCQSKNIQSLPRRVVQLLRTYLVQCAQSQVWHLQLVRHSNGVHDVIFHKLEVE